MVDPERNPRQHDDQHRRQVVLEEEETDVAFQLETQRQPLIAACDITARNATAARQLYILNRMLCDKSHILFDLSLKITMHSCTSHLGILQAK